jgi:hypothetical protein
MAEADEHQAPSEDRTPKSITSVRPPNLPAVYINAANVAMGQLELRLYLAETTPNQEGDGLIVTDKVCIIMTPEFVKYLAQRLTQSMQAFEENYGKLREIAFRNDAQLSTVRQPEVELTEKSE